MTDRIRIPSTVSPGRHLTIRAAVDRMTNLPRPGEVAVHSEDAENAMTIYVPVETLRAALDEVEPRPDGDLRERAASMAQRLDVLSYDLMVGGQDNAYRSTMAISGVPDLRTAANLLRDLATLPAPVVSGEAVEAIIARVAAQRFTDDEGFDVGGMHSGHAVMAVMLTLAALGITVADAPEAGERRG